MIFVNAPSSGGIVELKELLARLATVREVKFAIDRGNDPVRLLLKTDRPSKRDNRLQSEGKEPVKEFDPNANDDRLLAVSNESGIVPVKLLFVAPRFRSERVPTCA